jgi:hypothetical protein
LIGTGGDHAVAAPTVERLRKQNPSARIVVLSDRCEWNDTLAVLRAGADGYLFEKISRDALIKSLDMVMLGAAILPAAVHARTCFAPIAPSESGASLSVKQWFEIAGAGQQVRMTFRPNGRLSTIADANLPKDRLDVDFDGRFGDIKLTCDNFVGFALP